MKSLIFSFCLALLLFACSLERDNPLDPDSGKTRAPSEVINLQIAASGENASTNWVRLTWDPVSEPDTLMYPAYQSTGYYVYRGLSYEGRYEKLTTIPQADSLYYKDFGVFSGTYYYYRVSAYYRYSYDEEPLEGPQSTPVYIKVE